MINTRMQINEVLREEKRRSKSISVNLCIPKIINPLQIRKKTNLIHIRSGIMYQVEFLGLRNDFKKLQNYSDIYFREGGGGRAILDNVTYFTFFLKSFLMVFLKLSSKLLGLPSVLRKTCKRNP